MWPASATAWSAATTPTSSQAAGLSVPGELLKLWDFSVGVGGPIVKDRLWYFGNVRNEGSHRSVPGMYANMNAGDPTKRTYEADLTRQSRQRAGLSDPEPAADDPGDAAQQDRRCSGTSRSRAAARPGRPTIDGCRRQSSSGFIYGGTATISPEAGGTGAGGTSGGYVAQVSARPAGDLVVAGDQPASCSKPASAPISRATDRTRCRAIRRATWCASDRAVHGRDAR